MREMTDRVKRGEPIYGTSQLTEYMQGVASRQSRYAGLWSQVMPWANFVNHNQVCPVLVSTLPLPRPRLRYRPILSPTLTCPLVT